MPAHDGSPALEISELRFSYTRSEDDGTPFELSVPHLALAPAEQVLLTATSGGGKSTLLSIVAGLLDPQAGSVRIAGTDIHTLHGAKRDLFRGRHVGMIFQTFNLLTGFSCLENILAALMFSDIPHRSHREIALGLLKTLGIPHPDRHVERLSVGQQQRVAVARAVACNPVLVLADEPTASLDPENSAGAIDLVQRVCAEKGAALLCVSHDPAMADRFTRRLSLAELARGRAVGVPA